MKRPIVVCAALLLWAGSAKAKDIGEMTKAGLVSETPDACGVGYSSYCPSGNCECEKFVGDIFGSHIGRRDDSECPSREGIYYEKCEDFRSTWHPGIDNCGPLIF